MRTDYWCEFSFNNYDQNINLVGRGLSCCWAKVLKLMGYNFINFLMDCLYFLLVSLTITF